MRGRWKCGSLVLPLAALGALATASVEVRAQAPDIAAVAAMRGIDLPEEHYELLRQDPHLYEFRRALFARVGAERTSAFGEVRLPVILALFSDSPATPHVSRETVQGALFGTGGSARGTITESYLEMSRGALTVDGDVFGWTRSTLPMDSVVGSYFGLGSDNRVGEYFLEALEDLDPGIDFTLYDNDGPDGIANSGDDDGFVDVVTFEYLEVAASCGGPAIWPHRSSLEGRTGQPYVTDDLGYDGSPIRVSDYITQSATDCSGSSVQGAEVITHEFGHALGLPDWYHWVDPDAGPAGRRWVLGCWALMAAGSWGCGPVTEDRSLFGPTHMIGYSKDFLGWVDFVEVGEVWNETFELTPMETSGHALRIPLDDAGGEYLLIEYRDTVGFDRDLPGPGVLMVHHDVDAALRPDPQGNDPYFLTMVEQDDDRSLRLMADEGGSRGEIGDAWGVDGVVGSLTATTTPALRLNGSGAWTRVQIHEVAVEGDRARLVLSTGATPRLVEASSDFQVMPVRTFREGVRVAGGRGPYEGVGALPSDFSLESDGDALRVVGSLAEGEVREFTFAVRDQRGSLSGETTIRVVATGSWVVTEERLFQAFLHTGVEPLTAGELDRLDELGNGNGRYDVGDLRRWLRENR